MFGELPKLLDRNYAIGFFLPAALIAGICLWVLGLFGLTSKITLETNADKLIGGALATGIVWLVSILLMALNGAIDRMLQGYGGKPVKRLRNREQRRFERLALPALRRQAAYEDAVADGREKPTLPPTHGSELRLAAELFPDDARWVLATGFGNRMRAVEVYARAVYGLDTVPVWPRLEGLISAEFREQMNAAKAQLDFCMNLVAGGIFVLAGFLALALSRWSLPSVWPPLVGAAMTAIGYFLAVQAVRPYGRYLRSVFDLYRGALAEQLGLKLPERPEDERRMWEHVSRMFIYRSGQRFLDLAEFRANAKGAAAAGLRIRPPGPKPPPAPPCFRALSDEDFTEAMLASIQRAEARALAGLRARKLELNFREYLTGRIKAGREAGAGS